MALVSWYLATLLLVLIRTQAYGAPAPENEVPLRPTTWLPEGKLTTVTLPKGRTRRLYFTLKKKVAAMSVTVSPCDVQIEWSLSARTLKDKPVSEKPLKSLQWSSRKSLPEVWWKSPGMEEKIHSFKGNRVDTYTSSSLPSASIYILRLRSRQQSSRATVYHHEGQGSPGVFPLIPDDPRVHTLGVGMTSVTLSWAPSLSITNLPDSQKSYEYCVLVNSENNHHGLCSAQESVSKDQRKEKKEKKERKRVTAWPMLKEWWWEQWDTEADPLPAEPQCACQGTESDCTVSDLLPDTKYYFDVFVLDRVNGTSAAYKGMAAQTHEEARSVITSLREGELRWVTFPNREPKSDQFFSFHPRSSQGSGLLTLQGCSRGEKIRVKVSSKGQVLNSEAIGVDLVQIWLQGSSSYLIHLEREESPKAQDARLDSATSVKIQTSSAYHRRGVPSMPSTLQVKSFNRLRGCSSVTLAWMGTEERSLYCVYRRQLRTEETEASLNMPCLGPESRSDTERVLCKYFQELNPRRAVTTAVIGGLEPGVAYVFDVYLMRRWGIPVKYASKVVRTRKEC